MNKKVMKLFFAMLSVLGAGTLIACNSQTHFHGPSIVENSNSSSEKEDTSNNQSTSQHTDENSNSNQNTSSDANENSESKPTQEEIDRQIKEQLISYEDTIETKLKNTLNEKFKENVVSNVDIKTFDLDTNEIANTTLLASGYVNFVGDNATYRTNLGMPVGADDFLNLTPISYVQASLARNVADNYTLDQLTPVYDYITGANLTFNYATLNNANWDLDCFTATQVENYLEEKYTNLIIDYFTQLDGKPWVHNVDLKYVETDNNVTYGGDIIKIHGTTSSIKTGKVMPYYVMLRTSNENYQTVKNMLTEEIDKQKDLAENYNFTTLNTLKNIFDSDDTQVIRYSVDKELFSMSEINNNKTL